MLTITMKKKQQVVIVHGGTSFKKYGDFIRFLKIEELTIAKLKPRKGWKLSLESRLGGAYEVLQPRMPNPNNAKYEEWKLWFEKLSPLLRNGVILVGHSLGGLFLAKYLSENKFPKKIAGLVLIAAPFSRADENVRPSDFAKLFSLEKINSQTRKIILFHSKDDPLVPVKEVERYKAALPSAKALIFSRKGHFGQEQFPELTREIKKLKRS
jgi:predicted alpha/beta hydrolase family esterase